MKVGVGLLAFDFVGATVNQQREYVGARQYGVHDNLLPVEAALPHTLAALKFESMRFAIHYDFVNHTMKLSKRLRASFLLPLRGGRSHRFNASILATG